MLNLMPDAEAPPANPTAETPPDLQPVTPSRRYS